MLFCKMPAIYCLISFSWMSIEGQAKGERSAMLLTPNCKILCFLFSAASLIQKMNSALPVRRCFSKCLGQISCLLLVSAHDGSLGGAILNSA